MRAILLAIAWTLAASAAAHPGDQYSEGNQRRGEEPDAPGPAVLASEASTWSDKSPVGDHVLTSLEVLQLSGLLNDPTPRAQRGDIEVVEEPKPDDRGDVPGSVLYGHLPGRSKRHTRSTRKLLWANKEKDAWGFGEEDGLVNDQPSSDEDDKQQHIKRPMNHHRNHHRQEDYRRAQDDLRRPQEQFRRPQESVRRPEDQYRRPQEQYRHPHEDRASQEADRRRQWEEQERRRQEEEQRRAQQEEQQRRRQEEEQRRAQQEEQQRRRQEAEQRRTPEGEQQNSQEEVRRRQWEQQRRTPENQRQDPNSQKTVAPTTANDTYEERLREWHRMKEEHDRLIRERENARNNPNHHVAQNKSDADLENERKLQEYIRRNTPINLTRSGRPENLTRSERPERPRRPGQPDNVSKSGRPEQTRPAEDPRKDERRHRGQYDADTVRRRQEEQQRRLEEEERRREEARTRSPPVNNQHQENEQVGLAELQRREKDEERRRLNQQQGRNVEDQRRRPDMYLGHHIPSPVDERRRPEDPMRHLRPTPDPDEHQRVIRPDDPASQHHESPDQNWSAGRRNPVRVENPAPENRGSQNWWAQRPEDEARRQEIEKCRRLVEEDDRRRREEEARRRQPTRPDQPGNQVPTRPEDEDRYHPYTRNEAKVPRPPSSYRNETEEEQLRRLRALPVGARIIVRADGSNYTYPGPAALTLRQGFGDEIAFTGFSPAKSGIVASSFPSPVTEHAPAASPPSCVWALVVCCRNPRSDPMKVRRCFEATDCLSWDSNKCGLDNILAANEELTNFYQRERTKASRPLVYQFED